MALDIAIRGGTVYDGSDRPPVAIDVGIAGGRIVAMGEVAAKAEHEIDAAGLAVAPGFIDIHSHSDYTLLVDPRAVSAIAQGVTTEVIGNCGFGCAPIGDPKLAASAIYGFDDSIKLTWRGIGAYLDRLAAARPAVNVMTLVPNGQLRLAAVGLADRPAAPGEVARMRDLLREGLSEGAVGYSIGLEYPAEVGCAEDELVALARESGRAGGFYATHTRNRAAGAAAAVEEAIRTARAAEVRLQVSHLMPRSGDAESRRCLDAVEAARARGQDIAFDMHTRLYGTTMLSTLLPPWSLVDGVAGLRAHLAASASRARIRSFTSIIASVGDWEKVVLLDVPGMPDVSRLSLAEIGRRRGRDPHDCALDILAEAGDGLHRPMVILNVMSEATQKLAFGHPLCVPGSDATTLAPDGPLAGSVFHGAYTWAAWFWRAAVREWRLLKPEEAVNRLTGRPAAILGLTDRGAIAVGAHADVAVFDPREFGERGTTFEPNQLARGMRHVIVNGALTLGDGAPTGTRAGAIIKRHGPALAF
ncbi:MAG: amidohydrolase family protein [Alphaproteobacteria bacterium]|nr:amidohydrolase family protein [Alphaproteobacteria bacterium]